MHRMAGEAQETADHFQCNGAREQRPGGRAAKERGRRCPHLPDLQQEQHRMQIAEPSKVGTFIQCLVQPPPALSGHVG